MTLFTWKARNYVRMKFNILKIFIWGYGASAVGWLISDSILWACNLVFHVIKGIPGDKLFWGFENCDLFYILIKILCVGDKKTKFINKITLLDNN